MESESVGSKAPRLPVFEFCTLALGFGMCRVWVITGMALAAEFPLIISPIGYDQVMLFAGACMAIVIALLANRCFSSQKGLWRLNVIILASMALTFTLIGVANATSSPALLTAGFALAGIASAALQIAWGECRGEF